jgi:ribosome biogenesis protein MAK21
MKAVVAREISALILKPMSTAASTHIRFDEPKVAPKKDPFSHARYYGLITLNQIPLSSKDPEVAGRLVDLYFEMFREILGDQSEGKDEVDQTEQATGKVEKWKGRRKGSRPKGKGKAVEEDVVESGETRMVVAILTGINRALPYAKLDDEA